MTEDVGNAAVFDSATRRYLDMAPKLGGGGSTVYDLAVYRDDVVIASNVSGPAAEENNPVVVDGATGKVIR